MVEHAAVNRGVEGSSPSSGAIFISVIFPPVSNGGKAVERRVPAKTESTDCSATF